LTDRLPAPLLATLPGRLRAWADAALGGGAGVAAHDLIADPAPAAIEATPMAVLLDEPANAIADLMELGLGATDAAGRISVVLSLASDWPRPSPARLVMRTARDTTVSLRDRLCWALDLPPGSAPPPDLPPQHRPPGGLARQLAEGFIAPLQEYAAGGVQAVLTWPRACFRLGTPPQDTAPERVELVGPARSVVFGPYLALPAGWWEAEFQLFFSEEACRRTFTIDMIAEDLVGTLRLKPASAGTFRTRMLFHNPRASWPVALRLVLENGAIEGRIGLESVTLRHARSQGFPSTG
jgi:hypothetical protein